MSDTLAVVFVVWGLLLWACFWFVAEYARKTRELLMRLDAMVAAHFEVHHGMTVPQDRPLCVKATSD